MKPLKLHHRIRHVSPTKIVNVVHTLFKDNNKQNINTVDGEYNYSMFNNETDYGDEDLNEIDNVDEYLNKKEN